MPRKIKAPGEAGPRRPPTASLLPRRAMPRSALKRCAKLRLKQVSLSFSPGSRVRAKPLRSRPLRTWAFTRSITCRWNCCPGLPTWCVSRRRSIAPPWWSMSAKVRRWSDFQRFYGRSRSRWRRPSSFLKRARRRCCGATRRRGGRIRWGGRAWCAPLSSRSALCSTRCAMSLT